MLVKILLALESRLKIKGFTKMTPWPHATRCQSYISLSGNT